MKRILCLWFPHWPVQRIVAAQPELKGKPVVVAERRGRTEWVSACSPEAQAWGIRVGMSVAEAKALVGAGPKELAPPRRTGGRGFRPGASLQRQGQSEAVAARTTTHASGLAPGPLCVVPADPLADRHALEQLAHKAQGFTPRVGLEDSQRPECLLLDLTGLGHLFGGEERLATRVCDWLVQAGWTVRAAGAESVGAAWAFAHFALLAQSEPKGPGETSSRQKNPDAHQTSCPGDSGSVGPWVPARALPVVLGALPVEALRISPAVVEALHGLGIVRIEHLEALPRAELALRFGSELGRRLDQAYGRLSEPIPALPIPPDLEVHRILDWPVADHPTLARHLDELVGQIGDQLVRGGRGALEMECVMRCESGREVRFSVGLFRPTASASHLRALLALQWESRPIAGAVEALQVRVLRTARLCSVQRNLWEEDSDTPCARQRAELIERLSNRLGRQAVLGARLVADAQPERAYRYDPVIREGDRAEWSRRVPAEAMPIPPRPLRLLPRPIRILTLSVLPDRPPVGFHWQNDRHRVAACWGPERIETGWWRGGPVGRDYWRVETTAGLRFWLFRRLRDNAWFVHGLFD